MKKAKTRSVEQFSVLDKIEVSYAWNINDLLTLGLVKRRRYKYDACIVSFTYIS